MKKNISINISGIIFHIEEDGYEELQKYLDSINDYFSAFDDSSEIISDIEGRIAEIFLAKLSDGKQVITQEDVGSLMKTMGSIRDFEAVEEPEFGSEKKESKETASEENTFTHSQPRKLYRDNQRKILGGVASGIAYYFNIDPLWIRLVFALFLVGGIPGAGVLVLIYIIFWIVVPGSDDLEEDTQLKRLYRNPDDKVIGGVSGGLAAYFGVDVSLIRVIFVITGLFGAGILLYIILWIITPEAKSITEKMQMQGEPVTLSGIESTVKKSLKVENEEEESPLVRILLFPFRLLATLFEGIGRALGPFLLFLVDLIRILAGAVLIIIGFSMLFGTIFSTGILVGLFSSPGFYFLTDVPVDFYTGIITPGTTIGGFFFLLIPGLILALLGISIIAKRIVFNATFGWSVFAIWVISCFWLAFSVPPMVADFREDGTHKVTQEFDMNGKTTVLMLNDLGESSYDATTLKIRGHEDSVYRLEQNFEARGRTRQLARNEAASIIYNVTRKDSILSFDSHMRFQDSTSFRRQELDMTLYVPVGQPFKMDPDLDEILRSTIYFYDYSIDDLNDENIWQFESEKGLICLTCPEVDEFNEEEEEVNLEELDLSDLPGFREEFDLEGVENISISSTAEINIVNSDRYEMIISGDEDIRRDLEILIRNSDLVIEFDRAGILKWSDDEEVRINIFVPELRELNLSGAGRANVSGFGGNSLRLDINGSSKAEIEAEYDDLRVEINGASRLKLFGNGERLTLESNGGSVVDALDYRVETCRVEASGASQIKVFVEEELEADANGGSTIRYSGDPRVDANERGASTIKKY